MMTNERRKRAGVQLCYPFEEKRLAKWEPPYIVQPKLDGERCGQFGTTLTATCSSLAPKE